MPDVLVEPWILPAKPDLARLSMEVADHLGIAELGAWPEARKGGIGFGVLPPYLSWHGVGNGMHHLVLLQAREVGALVPGARMDPLPNRWLVMLDLESLARPLAYHPAWGGTQASIHVVHLPKSGEAMVRSYGPESPEIVRAVLAKLSDVQLWSFAD